MRNSYNSSNSPRTRSFEGRARSAFTLVEMLVAVGMGAMLVVGAAGVFSLATQAVGSSQANTEINNQLRVLWSWLDRDFARIRLDGPLVLNPQDADLDGDSSTPDEAVDQVCFLISGDIPSMRSSNSASLAAVLYGPDVSVDTSSLAEPYKWVFTRRGTLIVGDPNISVGVTDIQQSSFAQIVSVFYAAMPTNSTPPSSWDVWTKPDFYYDAGSGTYLFSDPDELPAYLLGNVVSFRIVRYYMAGASAPVLVNTTTAVADLVFYPTEPKPAWIEFEIVLRDSAGRLKNGYTATYRVNLPSR